MPQITGPQLESISKALKDWYITRRLELIDVLTSDEPYGKVHLSPVEQYTRFLEMQPEDWVALIADLSNRYRGLPDSQERVNQDLYRYVAQMTALGQEYGSPEVMNA